MGSKLISNQFASSCRHLGNQFQWCGFVRDFVPASYHNSNERTPCDAGGQRFKHSAVRSVKAVRTRTEDATDRLITNRVNDQQVEQNGPK